MRITMVDFPLGLGRSLNVGAQNLGGWRAAKYYLAGGALSRWDRCNAWAVTDGTRLIASASNFIFGRAPLTSSLRSRPEKYSQAKPHNGV